LENQYTPHEKNSTIFFYMGMATYNPGILRPIATKLASAWTYRTGKGSRGQKTFQGKMAVFTAKLELLKKSVKTCNLGLKTAVFPANFK
jgi:hypothetical protein